MTKPARSARRTGCPHTCDRAPPPASAHDSLDAVLAHLLSPARSGVVLARGHLAALARDGDLGLRMGDRRRILRALVDQDPATTLNILTEWAEVWAIRHRADETVAGPIAAHWADRAAATAALLRTGARTHVYAATHRRRRGRG